MCEEPCCYLCLDKLQEGKYVEYWVNYEFQTLVCENCDKGLQAEDQNFNDSIETKEERV